MIEDGGFSAVPSFGGERIIPKPTAQDRPWRTYEMVFMFAKSPKYFFNRRELTAEEDIWTVSARRKANNGLHPAAFPDRTC